MSEAQSRAPRPRRGLSRRCAQVLFRCTFRRRSGRCGDVGIVTSAVHTSAPTSVPNRRRPSARAMLNKVPEVTLYFWIIKVLCTTVGETAADYLNENLGLGLTKTTFVTGARARRRARLPVRVRRYVPGVYWLAVVLISVVGTLITDNLTDNFGVSLVTTTVVFSSSSPRSSPPGTRASGRSRSTRSSRPAARRSTGSPSSSRSRSARPPATSRRSGSPSATGSRRCSSRR